MSEPVIIALFGSLGGIIAAFNLPKILEAMRAYRETKHKNLVAELAIEKEKTEQLKVELQKVKEQLTELQIKLSIVVPIVKNLNKDDNDTLELMKIIERNTGINLTPEI
ncbi:hypothetical protein [Nonlabens agnitus]|uniref:Uncharacterized protein n=1 Tax=Nonlabens agnitus TaxID=870484 RepID=A0A2S9WXA3_9FLAO|nr:hypothetical protein [Nonlabens agnitus]PRP68099.1 hypothetical protein BST86_13890 [Nonlabens agnitus]